MEGCWIRYARYILPYLGPCVGLLRNLMSTYAMASRLYVARNARRGPEHAGARRRRTREKFGACEREKRCALDFR